MVILKCMLEVCLRLPESILTIELYSDCVEKSNKQGSKFEKSTTRITKDYRKLSSAIVCNESIGLYNFLMAPLISVSN